MLTELGKVLRKMRIDKGELLKDMADKLSISPSYLSAIESSERNIPDGFIKKVIHVYKLTLSEAREIETAAQRSIKEVKFDLSQKSQTHREAAILLARKFDSLDDCQLEAFIKLLKKGSDD